MATHSGNKRQWELEGTFRLWLYLPSHSQLMFRSLAKQDGVNTDILFSGVTRMQVETNYQGISLHELGASEAADYGIEIRGSSIAVRFMNTMGDYVVCGAMTVLKNQLDRFQVPIPVPIIGVDS